MDISVYLGHLSVRECVFKRSATAIVYRVCNLHLLFYHIGTYVCISVPQRTWSLTDTRCIPPKGTAPGFPVEVLPFAYGLLFKSPRRQWYISFPIKVNYSNKIFRVLTHTKIPFKLQVLQILKYKKFNTVVSSIRYINFIPLGAYCSEIKTGFLS